MQVALEPPQTVHVARQPILHRSGRGFAYELLYRSGAGQTTCTSPVDVAGARVLSDAVLTIGLSALTGGLPAFVNLTRQLLVSDAGTLLPRGAVVLELLEDIPADSAVIDACRRLHKEGYKLALDDFVAGSDAEALLPYAKFVKVDVLTTPADLRAALAKRLLPRGVRLIAEKVETAEMAKQAAEEGYSLFQGYFFCRPTTLSSGALPAQRLAYVNLLGALQRPDLSIDDLEELVKRDVSLGVRVLRCINSAAYGVHREIHSVRQGLVLLGVEQVRKWASIWALAGLNGSGTPEVAVMSIVRAQCCELIGQAMSDVAIGSEFFLLGLCSLLDVLLCQPMPAVLAALPLPAEIHDALMGTPNAARLVLDAVVAYERGAWDEAAGIVQKTGVSASLLSTAYASALQWAQTPSELLQRAREPSPSV